MTNTHNKWFTQIDDGTEFADPAFLIEEAMVEGLKFFIDHDSGRESLDNNAQAAQDGTPHFGPEYIDARDKLMAAYGWFMTTGAIQPSFSAYLTLAEYSEVIKEWFDARQEHLSNIGRFSRHLSS